MFFVNGNKPQRITDAVSGKKFEGTLYSGDRMEEYVVLVDQNDHPNWKRRQSKMSFTKRKASQSIYCVDIQW